MSNNTISVAEEAILNKIYVIRDKKIMLDYDLAEMFDVETKQLKRQVRRNMDRFPEDFMFELTQEEHECLNLRYQNGTSTWGGARYLPMAFTEQGVAMLSSVLNSSRAIQVNIQIIRLFTRMREMLLNYKDILLSLEQLENQTLSNTRDVKDIFEYLKQMLVPVEQLNRRRIGFVTTDQSESDSPTRTHHSPCTPVSTPPLLPSPAGHSHAPSPTPPDSPSHKYA